jgi:hypothetical protein
MRRPAPQTIPAPRDGAPGAANGLALTASECFADRTRWPYDPIAKSIPETAAGDSVAFQIAGSKEDALEPRQIVAPRERLAAFEVEIRMFLGGHLTASEHPGVLAGASRELADAGVGQPIGPHPDATEETTP